MKSTLLIIYFIAIFGLILFTMKNHKEQNLEHFALISSSMKYSNCKDKCLLSYSEDKDKFKTCKSYCKCKKRCNMSLTNKKKCNSTCKEKKMNLYRDDKTKMEKINIKDKLKNEIKKNKKKEKIKYMKFEKEKQNGEVKNKHKSQNYFNRILNDYFGETNKEYIINMNRGSKKFKKDFKKVFTKYF